MLQMFFSWVVYVLSVWLLVVSPCSECRAGDFKVAIDIGHTQNTAGATSARGVPEYFFNRNMANLIYQNLRKDRRFKGSFIINSSGADIALAARAAIANSQRADLFLSIHHDSVEPKDLSYWQYHGKAISYCDKFSGFSIFYSEGNSNPLESLTFAVVLGSEMLRNGFCPTLHHVEKFKGGNKDLIDRNRGIYKYNNLIVLKNTKMPAVLFECGIIKNKNEELQLSNSNHQQKIAGAVVNAIKKYISYYKYQR